MTEFKPFPKMARLNRECLVTEKIDGTNASIFISETTDDERGPLSWDQQKIIAVVGDMTIRAGSRTRWITPSDDNFGFAAWANQNRDELIGLGVGHHFGEWWGSGIQRGYGFKNGERFFSLFNALRWVEHDMFTYPIENPDPKAPPKFTEKAPACCRVIPILYSGLFDTARVDYELDVLHKFGSQVAPGYMNPEGIVVFHIAGNVGFKKTLIDDHKPKGKDS